jgi:hypothetical protein
MCNKCVPLDKKIEHYEKIAVSIGDRVTVERLMALIADLRAQKAAFIPSKSSKTRPISGIGPSAQDGSGQNHDCDKSGGDSLVSIFKETASANRGR